jgi:hypothetical protein
MIQIEIILVAFAIFCCVMTIRALLDLKSVVKSMRMTTGRIIKRCDNMIAICDDAGKIGKRLIKSRGRK